MKANRVLGRVAIGLAAVLGSASVANAEISWNGFGSVYYGQLLDENFLAPPLTNADPNFTTFSRLGLNISGGISNNMDFAAQLIATGGNAPHSGFDMYAQWAFLNYRLGDATLVRAGRQILPTFLASEFARVGFLLPYRSIPTSHLNPFVAFDGLTLQHVWQLGDSMKLTGGIYGGEAVIDLAIPAPVSYRGNNMYGARLTLDGDGWRFHLNGLSQNNELSAGGPVVEARSTAITTGFRYDKHNIVSWTEYSRSEATSGAPDTNGNRLGENREAVYSLLGYRIGAFMPRYTYAYGDYINGNNTPREIFASHTVGLNYQLNPQAVFKVEYEHGNLIQDNGDTQSFTYRGINGKDSGGVVYAGIDFVF